MGSIATNAQGVCLLMLEHKCIGYHRLMCLIGKALRIGSIDDGTCIASHLSVPRFDPLVAIDHCPHPWPAVPQASSLFSYSYLVTQIYLLLPRP